MKVIANKKLTKAGAYSSVVVYNISVIMNITTNLVLFDQL